MAITNDISKLYTRILKTELKAATGCTEPIAIAYCAACARKVLGCKAQRYEVSCSGNIIKNVMAVTIPQTGGLKGIEAATLAGGIAGNADAELEVLANLTDADRAEIQACCNTGMVAVKLLDSPHTLHIVVQAYAGEESASVELIDSHSNLGTVLKNGHILAAGNTAAHSADDSHYDALNIADIMDYADHVNIEEIAPILDRQIACNCAISNEGLKNIYGAGIGPLLMQNAGTNPRECAKAAAAAGSDARMNGCAMPVVINSGSGNQGITVSLPIIIYAQAAAKTREQLLRALCVGNLIAIRQKASIGKLSAFCGATTAAVGAVAGIAYMQGDDYQTIAQMITNSLATIGGMVCDGAKSSCASKIVMALESAFIGYDAAKAQRGCQSGEGIVKKNVECTIESIGRMASVGMRATDTEILNIMLEGCPEDSANRPNAG